VSGETLLNDKFSASKKTKSIAPRNVSNRRITTAQGSFVPPSSSTFHSPRIYGTLLRGVGWIMIVDCWPCINTWAPSTSSWTIHVSVTSSWHTSYSAELNPHVVRKKNTTRSIREVPSRSLVVTVRFIKGVAARGQRSCHPRRAIEYLSPHNSTRSCMVSLVI
jgi:hypothetical protein